jgi:hypothetical protein
MKKLILSSIALTILCTSCKKEDELVVISGNEIPDYNGTPTILVENYVNRLFIDLIGREPTDTEMDTKVTFLKNESLSNSVREELVDELMYSTEFIEGDSSYTKAYFLKFYNDMKGRLLEGSSEATILEEYYLWVYLTEFSLQQGNLFEAALLELEANKIKAVLDSKAQLRDGIITIDEMCRRMCFNSIYDDINMNSFNFVNATFDQLFFRFPTESEFDQAFNIIEYNLAGTLFGSVAQNKDEYLDLLTGITEFDEGMIRWAFKALLSRDPNSAEVIDLLDEFQNNYDIQTVQKKILVTDEYAGF